MKRLVLTGFLMTAVLVLCACNIDIHVIVHGDDTATLGIEMIEKAENTDFIRRIPNMADYLDAWAQNLRQVGVLIDSNYRGENEHIYLQRHVNELSELSSPQELPGGVRAWTLVERKDQDGVAIYRYRAILDTAVLYGTAPGADPNVTAEMHRQLNEVKMTYSVTLPGRIVYTNADTVRSNRATWNIPMKTSTEIVAESHAEITQASPSMKSVPLWAWAVPGLLMLVGVLGLSISLLLHWRARA